MALQDHPLDVHSLSSIQTAKHWDIEKKEKAIEVLSKIEKQEDRTVALSEMEKKPNQGLFSNSIGINENIFKASKQASDNYFLKK